MQDADQKHTRHGHRPSSAGNTVQLLASFTRVHATGQMQVAVCHHARRRATRDLPGLLGWTRPRAGLHQEAIRLRLLLL